MCVAENGCAVRLSCEVRHTILSTFQERLAKRGRLKHLKCLDVQNWPQRTHQVNQVAVEDFAALFNFYKRLLESHGISLDSLLADFDKVKGVWCTAVKPIRDNHLFWKQIVFNPTTFPCMHVMNRILLALTPTDAVFEAAFNRLTQILSGRCLSCAPPHWMHRRGRIMIILRCVKWCGKTLGVPGSALRVATRVWHGTSEKKKEGEKGQRKDGKEFSGRKRCCAGRM